MMEEVQFGISSMRKTILICLTSLSALWSFGQQAPVVIQVDASKPVGEMRPFWSYFGYDEPNYTTQKNGQKLLTELTKLSPATVAFTNFLKSNKVCCTGPSFRSSQINDVAFSCASGISLVVCFFAPYPTKQYYNT